MVESTLGQAMFVFVRTCLSLDQPVCDVPSSGLTGSDDLYYLGGKNEKEPHTRYNVQVLCLHRCKYHTLHIYVLLPALFSSQSIEPLGLQPESLATDFPLICWGKTLRETKCIFAQITHSLFWALIVAFNKVIFASNVCSVHMGTRFLDT